MAVCAQLASRPGLGWFNVLVLLYFWNASKYAWMGAISIPRMLGQALRGVPSPERA